MAALELCARGLTLRLLATGLRAPLAAVSLDRDSHALDAVRRPRGSLPIGHGSC